MTGESGLIDQSESTPLINSERSCKEKGTTEEVDQNFSFSRTTKQERILLILMALMNFFASCCFSLLAPFFPAESAKKGVSTTVTGFIFGVFEFVVFLSSPIFGNFITKIGSKFMYISGVFITGTCAILFGILDKSPDGTVYIVMCFACRVVEALGCSAFITALFAIAGNVFPRNVTTVVGILETFSGLGMMALPAVGGALYTAGGFGTPFFVLGSIVITCGLLCAFQMPHINDHSSKQSKSILYLLVSPLAVVTGISIVAGSFSLGFMDPTLAEHLSKLNLNTWQIGLMFLIAPGIYAFTAPLWGWLTDSKGYVKSMMIVGNLLSGVGMLMLGPTDLISFLPFTLWLMIVSLIVIGLMVGFALIPSFKALLNAAVQMGMPENMDTHGIVSGFFNSCFSLGAFLGPTVGAAVVDKWGFSWGATGTAGIYFLAAMVFFVYTICSSSCLQTNSHGNTFSNTVYVEVDGGSSEKDFASNRETNT